MKQKADHHLSFVAERNETPPNTFLNSLSTRRSSLGPSAGPNGSTSQREHRSGAATHSATGLAANGVASAIPEEEDAVGESDDADFRNGAKGAMAMKSLPSGDHRDGPAASQPPECESGRRRTMRAMGEANSKS